jgi:hypothetical protein
MIDNTRPTVPPDHPIRAVFLQLTERGMGQLELRDKDTIDYVANLLTEFVRFENFYRVHDGAGQRSEYLFDMLEQAQREPIPGLRREYYRYLGDWTLFTLGLFPEMLTRGRRTVSPGFYAAQGRRSYTIVADLLENSVGNGIYRKMSQEYPRCVEGLHWIRSYINDPFYQYMFREFQVV